VRLGVALGLALAATAHADPLAGPCDDAIVDPVATPLREAAVDAQRSACLRDELAAGLTTHALIDAPNFHGVLGGDLALAGRFVVREHLELGARLQLVDYTFVQTAVNQATATRFGPLAISVAHALPFAERAQLAVVAIAELPYTRDDMATVRTSGQLAAVVTGALAARWLVHGRLGAVGAATSSSGGSSRRLGLRAGVDLGWRPRARLALFGGVETEAGWRDGLSTVLVRAGLQWRPRGGRWRLAFGGGAPLGGDEPTSAIVTLGLAHDL